MDSKRLIEALAMVDENHFVIVEKDCVEIYSKDDFLPTPTPTRKMAN